ncbi:hypothetical protein BGW36DRAFT_391741 [Talaromyces proteolyticus]|uniref:Phosphatidylglycerol lysyltransferase C-terminal domain-containing protein n=1 Tax=Talaromyces proteolyticus TaxID=1131652 RepID=A0AAD4PRK9_9EURO|nr:uncharacterized protein BGW36DRAFT_391741 [Talaromyces proteolyticus]KAH8689087.1 hypothetical protein BGW36DRAFT_391741 [Talaromyces proteolyticus]
MATNADNQKLSAEEKAARKKAKKERKLAEKKEQKELRKNDPEAAAAAQEAKKPINLFQEIGESMTEQLRAPTRMSVAVDSLDLMDRLRLMSKAADGVTPGEKLPTAASKTKTTTGKAATSDASSNASTLVNEQQQQHLKSPDYSDFSVKRKPVPRTSTSQSNLSEASDESASSNASTESEVNRMMDKKYRTTGLIFTLEDFAAMKALEVLFVRYGRVSHMGILDKSYSFFINKAHTAALYFKVRNKIAIVAGDPLCPPQHYSSLLAEFRKYRKAFGWGISFMGASDTFAAYAREKEWATIQFGTERVLNPLTNPVLHEQTGKRIIVQNKQLLHPTKGGNTLGIYIPSQGEDPVLQRELVGIYDAWRSERNNSGETQAFITVYDPFSLPQLMTYIYTRGPDGAANGFAALRKIGANHGYHIDPCIATPNAPKGISDLLIFSSMALLNQVGIDYLSFGFEPCEELGKISGLSKPIEGITRKIYRHTFPRLPITGKKAYHDKFRPDENQGSGLHLIFPSGSPGPKDMAAMAHMANISIRKVILSDLKNRLFPKKSSANLRSSEETPPNPPANPAVAAEI